MHKKYGNMCVYYPCEIRNEKILYRNLYVTMVVAQLENYNFIYYTYPFLISNVVYYLVELLIFYVILIMM